MSRYIKYIFLTLTAALLAVSCLEEMESPQPMPQDEALTLVPRIHNFANQYVTKAAYNADEHVISSISVLIFNSEGALLDILESTSNKVSVNKTNLSRHGSLVDAKIVMFANIKLDDVQNSTGSIIDNKGNLKYADLSGYTCHLNSDKVVITDLSISGGFTGFPMTGETTVDLSPTATQQAAIEVPLKILYAKISFDISVAAGTENQNYEGVTPSFTLSGYSVTNVPTSTPVKTLNDDETVGDVESTPSGTVYEHTGTESDPSKTVSLNGTSASTFTFYMAESRYNHGGTEDFYPAGLPDDNRQQYKPLLATTGTGSPETGLATYVKVNGTYIDYRGTSWTVNYKVYLGKNSYDNFHVDRNSEYKNYLTIKGIRNNDTYTDAGSVWIDHRVNVSTDDPSKHIKVTRETLIDSHIEVRPLRVKWDGETYAGVRVYLPTESSGSLVSWIGMERFTGENCLEGSTYCYVNGVATGKRKYFTTSLITELQAMGGEFGVQSDNGKKYLYLLNDECVWIYFDEHTGNTDREARIRLEFYSKDGNSTTAEEYIVKQRGLRTVEGYAIESYEEYLHTYDSADKYNLSTSPVDYTQQGLAWGLSNTSASSSQVASLTAIPGLNYYADNQYVKDIRYDFLHMSDGNYYIYSSDKNWGAISDDDKANETGLNFTNRATDNLNITISDMSTMPSNAYQYCLSKNKFKEDAAGNHTLDVHWYLPDIYELKKVLSSGTRADDFKSDSYYWSSQPSLTDLIDSDILDGIAGLFGGDVAVVDENLEDARAVSSTGVMDMPRSNRNRIRCFYDAEGKTQDMSDRSPDGMGGNFTFYMHAYTEKQKSSPAYFQYLLPAAENKPTASTRELNDEFGYNSTTDSYPYPTSANSSTSTEFVYQQYQKDDGSWIGGFEVNPGSKDNWDETLADYYSTLNTYPGLSKFVTQKGITTARSETSTEKKDVQTTADVSTIVYSKSLSAADTDLNCLDHINGGTRLSISFGTITGGNNSTFVYDEKVNESKTVITRYWEPPVYTSQSYNLRPNESTATGTDSGSAINTNVTTNKNDARKDAFNRAYSEAKDNALKKLNDYVANLNSTDPGWEISGIVGYTPLEWDTVPTSSYSNEFSVYVLFVGNCWSSTCTVTVTATAKIVKASSVSLYNITSEGYWRSSTETTNTSGVINTDELRFYCGNSFSISVNDPNYEISKVKVYFKGGNQIKTTTLPASSTHARFVDSTLIPTDGSNIIKTESKSLNFESVDVIQLNGMDYSTNSNSGEVWQQWSGNGRSSVTLVLADYHIQNGDWTNWTESIYTYKIADTDLSKYFIIDRIEVKCTKKATAATE